MRWKSLIPSTMAAFAATAIFASAVAAEGDWPETCDSGETWTYQGQECEATGSISVIAGLEFCNAYCGDDLIQFSMTPD